MAAPSALRPARLHHVAITSDSPDVLAEFYGKVLAAEPRRTAGDLWEIPGAERRMLIRKGAKNGLTFAGYAFPDSARLARYRANAETRRPPGPIPVVQPRTTREPPTARPAPRVSTRRATLPFRREVPDKRAPQPCAGR